MNGQEIKGRLDRIGKTVLEHFQDIKEVEVADGTVATVKDLLPYKCKQVEKSLKALEIIKKNFEFGLFEADKYKVYIYSSDDDYSVVKRISEEEFNTLKEVLE